MDLKQEIRRRSHIPGSLLGRNSGTRDMSRYQPQLAAVNSLEMDLVRSTDQQLQKRAENLQEQLEDGSATDAVIAEHFALVREASRRTVGLRPFDVQVIGGLGLFDGRIVQMQTGEGKTLAAVSPAALHAFRGRGVHILTFNDYLARRDAEWMGPLYRFLGLSVSFVQEGMRTSERQRAYQADVTYLTAKEAGFDYLRDGLVFDVDQRVQRPFYAALVDEADSILIDEARIPLVIAGCTESLLGRQAEVRSIVSNLEPGLDYEVDQFGRNVYLTEDGSTRAEALLECGDLYSPSNLQLLTELNLALHAEALMKRDVDYIVRNNRVECVDNFTGRVVLDRHWPYGLQTAIEAKEGLRTSDEGRVLGTITLQHFLRLYPFLSGMTATAETAADELFKFYGLELLKVPPNEPCIRIDLPDRIFLNKRDKHQALLAEIANVHSKARPILVGTISVEESEEIAGYLQAEGIDCSVLNAKNDEEEARIIAQAGNLGAVTISTNMAGRGTDIRLGGAQEADRDRVVALGGLYVIGTNRHESQRIDDQLRGRAGRQGDPGSSCFFISLEDEMLLDFPIAGAIPKKLRTQTNHGLSDNPIIRRHILHAQRVVEGQNFDIRRTLFRYSHFVERQRSLIAERRWKVLEGKSPSSSLEERPSAIHQKLVKRYGNEKLKDLNRRVELRAIDQSWSEHLDRITEIKDGIHLAEVGGLDPYREYLQLGAASFKQALEDIDKLALEQIVALSVIPNGNSLEQLGLRGPSSTWTYLVNDQVFTDRLAASLVAGRNYGFALGAAITGPLLLLWALLRRPGRS